MKFGGTYGWCDCEECHGLGFTATVLDESVYLVICEGCYPEGVTAELAIFVAFWQFIRPGLGLRGKYYTELLS